MASLDVIVDLGANIDELMHNLKKNREHESDIEREILAHLWENRGKITVDKMSELTGWTRQTIYNKWYKYGYNLKN